MRENNSEKSPNKRGFKTYIPIDIKELIRIVPVSNLKKQFHQNAHNVFKGCSSNAPCQIDQKYIGIKGL
jgi:hypothetical protein